MTNLCDGEGIRFTAGVKQEGRVDYYEGNDIYGCSSSFNITTIDVEYSVGNTYDCSIVKDKFFFGENEWMAAKGRRLDVIAYIFGSGMVISCLFGAVLQCSVGCKV